jgi:hypothetical protein
MSLRDLDRALNVLEATLQGRSLADCAKQFGLSRGRCAVLAADAARLIHSMPHLPSNDWRRAAERMKHRDYWLSRIAKARRLNLAAVFSARRQVAADVGRVHGLTARQVLRLVKQYESGLSRAMQGRR